MLGFVTQMKLIGLSLILILAIYSEGQKWDISIQREYNITWDSDLTIPCNFSYPKGQHTENVTVYWKIPGRSNCSWNDRNVHAFIFHSDEMCVVQKYRKRTRLVGKAANGDCSLQISNIRENVSGIYVRVYGKSLPYSFDDESVSIFVTVPSDTSTLMYISIFVPVALLLVVLLVAGIFFRMRHKRSQTFTRKESGYYANFSRPSSDPPKRELSDKKDKELVEVKAIDEAIYINFEAPTSRLGDSMDITENVYANVDYSK